MGHGKSLLSHSASPSLLLEAAVLLGNEKVGDVVFALL